VDESIIGSLWFIAWLFTIGYAKLVWWRAAIALVIWPYYLGVAIRRSASNSAT
jgi:hypothetical protein